MLDDVDLDTIGLNFGVAPSTLTEVEPATSEEPEGFVAQQDVRTNEDIRAAARALVANALDLPEDIVDQARTALTKHTETLRDYLMTHVVPVVLSVNPAMISVQQMVPKIFDNGDETEVELPIDPVQSFAWTIGTLAARLKIIELMGMSDEVRTRLMSRLVPQEKRDDR